MDLGPSASPQPGADSSQSGASPSPRPERQLLSGDDAVARGALHAGVRLGTGYPGTPSTEILETLTQLGGPAQFKQVHQVLPLAPLSLS